MMMPANYSVIAENEMTYVNGGALIDCFAPLMTSSNWKTFNTNLIKIIGNSFMQPVIDATLGVMFGGQWGTDTLFGDNGSISGYYTSDASVLNKIMGTIGGLATIYTLGTADADVLQAEVERAQKPDLPKRVQVFFGIVSVAVGIPCRAQKTFCFIEADICP